MGIRWLRILIAVGILTFLFSRIPVRSVLDGIAGAELPWCLAATAAALAAEAVASRRLQAILRSTGLAIPFQDVFAVNLTARLYALALPAGNAAGFALRIHRLRGATGRYMDAVQSTFLDRVIATGSLAAVGIGAWFLDPGHAQGEVDGRAVGLLGLALLLLLGLQSLLLRRRHHPRLDPLVAWVERRWPARMGPLRPQWDPSVRPQILALRGWGWSLLVHGLGVTSIFCVALALGLEVSPITLAWTRSAALLLAILPISVGGLGLRDGAFVYLLGRYGVEGTGALAFSLLAYLLIAMAVALLGGALEVQRALR